MAYRSLAFPEVKAVTTGGGGGEHRAPVDSFTAAVPAMGGVPEQQAELGVQNAEATQSDIATREGAAGVDVAKVNEQGTGDIAAQAAGYSKAVAEFQASMQPKMMKIGAEADKAAADAASRKYENHWADQSTGTKVLAAISSFLGGLATGQPVSRAQEWIDKDHEQQKQQMDRLWKVAEAKGADRDHLAALMESGVRQLEAGYKGRVEAVKREIDHQAAVKGTEQARINGEKLKAEVDMNVAKRIKEDAKAMRVQELSHTLNGLHLNKIRTFTMPDGTKAWLNPGNGQIEPLKTPGQRPAPAAPTQPPPMVQP